MHVTIYNFDGASGLRNPFLGRPQGLVGTELVDGKPLDGDATRTSRRTRSRSPRSASSSPLAGVADDAKNQCGFAPCALSHGAPDDHVHVPTGKPGHYRWQCFVPCAAGFVYGFGGPMQTIGYMDGFLNVKLMAATARSPEQPSATPRPPGRRRLARPERDRDAARRDLPRPAHPARATAACRRRARSTTTS